MSEKRIKINDRTMETLKVLNPGLAEKPRSREQLEAAIEIAATQAMEFGRSGVVLADENAQFIDDLLHFGLFATKDALLEEALHLLKQSKASEFKEIVTKRLGLDDGTV